MARLGSHPPGRSLDTATSVVMQADGNIVVGGYSLDGNYRAIVARYLGRPAQFPTLDLPFAYGKLRAS